MAWHERTLRWMRWLYCALHRPSGKVQCAYHVIIIFLSSLVGILLNLGNIEQYQWTLTATIYVDVLLAVILFIEILLALWSTSCLLEYQTFRGKLTYLSRNIVFKTIDLAGLSTYVVYIITNRYNAIICIGHSLQILQLYRVIKIKLRIWVVNVYNQLPYIASLFLTTLFIFASSSRVLYIFEHQHNESGIHNMRDVSWLVFMTITSVGFGDKQPVTMLGKLVIVFAITFSMYTFSVMISMFSLQITKDSHHGDYKERLVSATSLVQNQWLFYRMRRPSFWKQYWSEREITMREKQCIMALQRIKRWANLHRFRLCRADIAMLEEDPVLYHYLLNQLALIERNIEQESFMIQNIKTQIADLQQKLNQQ